jgi:hypothetical protein
MHPPLHAVCAADTTVQDLLGGDVLRLYPFGEARQQETYPYAVWQLVGGRPENYLSDRPDVDSFSTQVDVYAVRERSPKPCSRPSRATPTSRPTTARCETRRRSRFGCRSPSTGSRPDETRNEGPALGDLASV